MSTRCAMKDNSGFTLIELLAVVALIALLSLIVVPSIMNIVNKNKPKLNSTTKELIYEATDLYLDANQTDYIKAKDAVYCITVEDLIDSGFLNENLINIETGEEYDATLTIKSSYNGYKYNYEILKSGCEGNKPDTSSAYIVIGELKYYRQYDKDTTEEKEKIYSSVDGYTIEVPITTNKVSSGTTLNLQIRRGSKVVSSDDNPVFAVTGGEVNDDKTEFTITVPSSAAVGEYVIEVEGGDASKTTKNFKIHINPIILFMGD